MRLHCEHLWRLAVFFRDFVLGATTLQLLFYHPQLLCNYFRNRQNYLGPRIQVFMCECVGGGCLGCQVSGDPARHSQLQSAYRTDERNSELRLERFGAVWVELQRLSSQTSTKMAFQNLAKCGKYENTMGIMGFHQNAVFPWFLAFSHICNVCRDLKSQNLWAPNC